MIRLAPASAWVLTKFDTVELKPLRAEGSAPERLVLDKLAGRCSISCRKAQYWKLRETGMRAAAPLPAWSAAGERAVSLGFTLCCP